MYLWVTILVLMDTYKLSVFENCGKKKVTILVLMDTYCKRLWRCFNDKCVTILVLMDTYFTISKLTKCVMVWL